MMMKMIGFSKLRIWIVQQVLYIYHRFSPTHGLNMVCSPLCLPSIIIPLSSPLISLSLCLSLACHLCFLTVFTQRGAVMNRGEEGGGDEVAIKKERRREEESEGGRAVVVIHHL